MWNPAARVKRAGRASHDAGREAARRGEYGAEIACYKRALEWRQKALPPIPQTEDPLGWLSASEMVHGDWATQFA